MASFKLDVLKSALYLDIVTDNYNDDLLMLKNAIVMNAIDYLDSDDITTEADIPQKLEHSLYQQITYDWKQRRDNLGLQSVTLVDGSINKINTAEWLPNVKKALDRVGLTHL